MFHRVGTSAHRGLFRLTGGNGRALGMPVAELVTTGRKSGQPRSTMLTVPVREPGRAVVVASFGGDDRDPAWLLNLRADPRVRLTIEGTTQEMVAREADESERAELWPKVVEANEVYETYQRRTSRRIPVVILEPASE